MPEPSILVTLGLAAVALIVWLVRLEGRVNALKDRVANAETKAETEATAHKETREALIRLEEAVKHQTRLIEQHFSEPRRQSKGGQQ